MTHAKRSEKVAKKVAKIADEQMPQNPLISHKPVSHEHVQHLLDNSVARAFGYGMFPRDMAGIRLVENAHGKV